MNEHFVDRKLHNWTDEEIEVLKRRWKDGASATEIASEIGQHVSRSAVLGKVHRLKLGNHTVAPKPNGVAGGQAKARRATIRKAVAIRSARTEPVHDAPNIGPFRPGRPIGDVIVDDGPRIPLLSLTANTCRWPSGDPKEESFGFCGAHVDGAIYCAKHQARAYHRAV